MRRHIFVRPVRSEDAAEFVEWSLNNPKNGFDPEVVKFPSTVVLCAYDQSGTLAYMPIQSPLFLESMAIRPGLDTRTVALTMKEFTQAAVTQAHSQGKGEIYFLGTEQNTDELATNQVFERLPYSVYRVKLKDLE